MLEIDCGREDYDIDKTEDALRGALARGRCVLLLNWRGNGPLTSLDGRTLRPFLGSYLRRVRVQGNYTLYTRVAGY